MRHLGRILVFAVAHYAVIWTVGLGSFFHCYKADRVGCGLAQDVISTLGMPYLLSLDPNGDTNNLALFAFSSLPWGLAAWLVLELIRRRRSLFAV